MGWLRMKRPKPPSQQDEISPTKMATSFEVRGLLLLLKLQHGKDGVITIEVIEQIDVTWEHYLRLLRALEMLRNSA